MTNAIIRRYVPGPGVDETLALIDANGVSYAMNDQRNTPSAWADAAGSPSAQLYGAFGEEGPANVGRIGFTGQMRLPELGLAYYKARFYDPQIGRFLTPDPAGYTDSPNLDAYVLNDPINLTDPSGLRVVTTCTTSGPSNNTVTCSGSPPSSLPGIAGGFIGQNDGGASVGGGTRGQTPPAMGMEERKCNQCLINVGNLLVQLSDMTGFASTVAISVGLPVAVGGSVTLQPEIAAPGIAMVEAGGALGVVSGVFQLAGGLAQGFGGAGFGNAFDATVGLAFGFALSRTFATPGGYRTVSQRTTDRFINNSTTVIGGGFDLFTAAANAIAPNDGPARCP